MSNSRQESFYFLAKEYIEIIPIPVPNNFNEMIDCVFIISFFQYLNNENVDTSSILKEDEKQWLRKFKEIKRILDIISQTFDGKLPFTVDINSLVRKQNIPSLENLFCLILLFAAKSSKKKEFITKIRNLNKNYQNEIKEILKLIVNENNENKITNSNSKNDLNNDNSMNNNEFEKKIEILKLNNIELNNKIKNLEFLTEENIMNQKANLTSEIFSLETQLSQKKNKFDLLNQIKEKISQLEKEKLNLLEENNKIENLISLKPDPINFLLDYLQKLRIDQKFEEINKNREDIKKLNDLLKAQNQKKIDLENKLNGKQNITYLEDKIDFINKIELENINRQKRIKYSFDLLQKKFRSEIFQKEMRSFI